MKSAFLLLMGSALLSSCAITQSSSCRKAAQGDIPCQGLNGLDFQKCQLEVRRAVATCQAEQMHKSPDSVGVYRLPPPDPTPAKAVVAPTPAPVAPLEVPEKNDSVPTKPAVADSQSVALPAAHSGASVDSVAEPAKSILPLIKIDSALPSIPSPPPANLFDAEPASDSLVAPKIDSAKSPVVAADSVATPLVPEMVSQDSTTSPAPKKSKKSKKRSAEIPSDSTATPVVSEPANVEAVPADAAEAIAPPPTDSIASPSDSATEPVKKKKRKKKKSAEPVAP